MQNSAREPNSCTPAASLELQPEEATTGHSDVELSSVPRIPRPARSPAGVRTRQRRVSTGYVVVPPMEARKMSRSTSSAAQQPVPVLEYYGQEENSASDSGEDTDTDEMEEDYQGQEASESSVAADKSIDESELSESESEIEEQDQDLDESLPQQEEGCSSTSWSVSHDATKSRLATEKLQQDHNQESSCTRQRKGRKQRKSKTGSASSQYAAELKRQRQNKLKHNKNEQIRRKDMKEAVYKLRNQLRRKTKKPSTISVLKAAEQEIKELTAVKTQEEEELEKLRQKELYLKYKLENLVNDHKRYLSSGDAGVVVHPRVAVGSPSFVHPTTPSRAPQIMSPSVHSRPSPSLPQLSLFPMPPYSTAIATSSPTAVGRVGLIDCPPSVAARPSIIAPPPPGLTPITRLTLPQPPTLIPSNTTTLTAPPPSLAAPHRVAASNLHSTQPIGSSSPVGPIALFPAAYGTNILSGVSPAALSLIAPTSHTSAQSGGIPLYGGFPSPFITHYPTAITRLPTSAVSASMIGGGLTPTHAHPHHTVAGVGRLSMTPSFPFPLFPPTALRPQPHIGLNIAGFNQYTAGPGSQPGTIRHLQFARDANLAQTYANSQRFSEGERNPQRTSRNDSEFEHRRDGSKNDEVSAEVNDHLTRSTARDSGNSAYSRITSAERQLQQKNSSEEDLYVAVNRGHEEGRHRATKRKICTDRDYDDNLKANDQKKQRIFPRYSRNSVISVSGNEPKTLLTTAPPALLKVINLEEESDTLSNKTCKSIGHSLEEEDPSQQQQRPNNCSRLSTASPLKNPEVISTVIKHLQPQREIVYLEKEDCRRLAMEEFPCRNESEHRWRVSNSLSSGDDEGSPDSPQQTFSSKAPSLYSFGKQSGRESHCSPSLQSLASRRDTREPPHGLNHHHHHKSLQYKHFRKMKSNLLRHHSNYNHSIVQSTT